jgi:hypothetical protein
MYGIASASACDAIADVDVRNPLAYGDYFSSTAVAESSGLIEPGTHGCHRGHHAIATKFAQNITHEIRSGPCFLQ